MKIKWSKGFTLIELMIVVVVIGILAAIIGSAIEGSENREEAQVVENHSQTAAIEAHTAGHDYNNTAYYSTVVLNASDDYQPVCVHGIPGFIPRRGPLQGQFIQLETSRGYKQAMRFWSACQKMGSELADEYEVD